MQRIDGSEVFFQKGHGIIIKTIQPFPIGLGVLPNLPSFRCSLISQKLVQIIRPKRRDAVTIFLFHIVKRESRPKQICF